jgi:hypothetical protein
MKVEEGKRFLMQKNTWHEEMFEVSVLEISPSTTNAKIRHNSGAESWVDIDHYFYHENKILEGLPMKDEDEIVDLEPRENTGA